MTPPLHILSFQQKLKAEKSFLQSLLCKTIGRRKLILEKASNKQLNLLQKLLVLFLRGEVSVTSYLVNKLKRSRKLAFIEQNFKKIKKDPDLRHKFLVLASVIHLFVRVILNKK